MDQNQYLDDLKHIRSIMERSSSFMSLSGLSGVSAGLVALCACFGAFTLLSSNGIDYLDGKPNFYDKNIIVQLMLLALLTLIVAIILIIYFTVRKSRRMKRSIWNQVTKQTMVALIIPLLTGGLFCLIMIYHHLIYLVAPSMLIFYGLALVSAGRYIPSELIGLGLIEIALGLISLIWLGYGLIFWGVGFGILHIGYGWYMYAKYE